MPRHRVVPLDPPRVTVRVRNGATLSTDVLEPLFPGISSAPLYDDQQRGQLKQLENRAAQLSPLYDAPDWKLLHLVLLPPRSEWTIPLPRRHVGELLRELIMRMLPVDRVTVEPFAPSLTVTDGTATADLKYLDPAPVGIGVESVWSEPGGRGSGEVLADVEYGWHMDHVELQHVKSSVLPGGVNSYDHAAHGTNVLSIALAEENNLYGIGVAPETTEVVLSSILRTPSTVVAPADLPTDLPLALLEAIDDMSGRAGGSVLLIEVGVDVEHLAEKVEGIDETIGTLKTQQGPVEMLPEVFELIQLAVANHIIVVEAAGNGGSTGINLDTYPELLHGDSGAILVGQSQWNSTTGHVAVEKGVTGERIDCFSWGFEVYAASVTSGDKSKFPGLDAYKDTYTTGFGGTSAAAAIIAGAAMVVQGMVRAGAAGSLPYLNPMQMRAQLGDRTPGVNTPLESLDTKIIGVQPDLKQIFVQLGVLPDLYIRDSVGDTGGPHTDVLSKSPDIILRVGGLGGVTADALFGEGSGAEDKDDLSDELSEGDTDAELYVRVRNRGGKDVAGAKVKTYYAKASTLVDPSVWTPIGEALVDVPVGDTIAIAGPIPWTGIPAAGHYCLVATVEHESDALFTPAAFVDVDAYKSYVRRENNVAWRNLNVVPATGGSSWKFTSTIAGDPGGAADTEEPMEIHVEAKLPLGATLEVELPAKVRARMSLPDGAVCPLGRMKLAGAGLSNLGLAHLLARSRHDVTLHVHIPAASVPAAASHEIALIQRHLGQPLGRVTWRLKAAAPKGTGSPLPPASPPSG